MEPNFHVILPSPEWHGVDCVSAFLTTRSRASNRLPPSWASLESGPRVFTAANDAHFSPTSAMHPLPDDSQFTDVIRPARRRGFSLSTSLSAHYARRQNVCRLWGTWLL